MTTPGEPDLLADESRGHDFVRFNVEESHFHINILSPIPLRIFQIFVSIVLFKNRLFIVKDGFHTSSKMARLIAGIPLYE